MHPAEYSILELHAPGAPVHNIGVLLLDPSTGRLHCRVHEDAAALAGDEDEVLGLLAEDLEAKAADTGGDRLLAWLEDTLSNTLRITDRVATVADSFTRELDQLFQKHVAKVKVLPFRTHLPLYSLRAAATRFGAEQIVEEEDWVRAPGRLRLAEGMFVAHVVGRSMEPRIPDGSLNIFRAPIVGSRQNKIVLVELLGERNDEARYTIKRYTSRKLQTSEEEWAHESITLHPLNPEFPAFDLLEGEFRVIAEWVQVLE